MSTFFEQPAGGGFATRPRLDSRVRVNDGLEWYLFFNG